MVTIFPFLTFSANFIEPDKAAPLDIPTNNPSFTDNNLEYSKDSSSFTYK